MKLCCRFQILLFDLCFLFLSILFDGSHGQDIIGCGGFVKSDIDISKAQVQVKLYTKQGSLKDQTECAPKNGYYFLPVYDKGSYILRIEPPKGWTFHPKEVPLTFDGRTDPCSQNKDINFEFKGFTVFGKVLSAGSTAGPEGITVHLLKDKKEIAQTVTISNGDFEFPSVTTGIYNLKISHPKWHVSNAETTVSVAGGNGIVKPGSLVVSGYDVSGKVLSDGEAVQGVNLILFQRAVVEGSSTPVIPGCNKQTLQGYKSPSEKGIRLLCHTQSDANGLFGFTSLPPGSYRVEPFYQGPQNLKFDLYPKSQDFVVSHGSVVLPVEFQIKGFTVSGRVLYTPNGLGVPHAYVLVNNQVKTETDKNGFFSLNSMQSGTYSVEAASDKLRFSAINVKVSPSSAQLPDLFPWGFEVCGRINPPRLEDNRPRTVTLSSSKDSSNVIDRAEADSAGLYCFHLKPGTYYASVQMSQEEKAKGLQYAPLVREVKVVNQPVNVGNDFSQLKARVHGKVSCLQRCSDISIRLLPLSPGVEEVTIRLKDDNTYEINEVLLGNYHVKVIRDDWCWGASQYEIEVSTAEVAVPVFKHVGYATIVQTSHNASINYELVTETPNQIKKTLPMRKGISRLCVPSAGTYRIQAVGCHKFAEPSTVMWNTKDPAKAIAFTAIGHTITGFVESIKQVDDLIVRIEKDNGSLVELQGPLKPKQSDGKWQYEISIMALENEDYKIIPQSAVMLFKPEEITMTRYLECAQGVFSIEAFLGQIISGEITPALGGVAITVMEDQSLEDPKIIAQTETDSKGQYRIGPLQPGVKYSVLAEKEGYVMTGPDARNKITARKLAEIAAVVTDRADGAPLQGVLLSVSGGAYRRNSLTGPDGQLSFKSLSPGEYYLRPLLKEYRFEPPALQFEVKEGDTVNVKLEGDRVAWSAYGTVTSLSKEPEAGVLVEAVGVDRERHNCAQLQEEAVTEITGQFRIKGLQPQCNYIVRVKPTAEANKHIYRATPDSIPLQAVESDVKNLRLIAFRPIAKTEVVAVVRSGVDTVEQLRSVKLRLCREETPDHPIHVVRLDSIVGTQGGRVHEYYPAGVMVHFPLIPSDGRGYVLQLESSLSPSAYDYSNQAVHFRTNVSFHYVPFSFEPIPRFVDQDMNQGSIFLLPLVLIALFSYFGRDHIAPSLKRLSQAGLLRRLAGDGPVVSERPNSREKTASRDNKSPREQDNSPDSSDGATVEQIGKKKKPRRT